MDASPSGVADGDPDHQAGSAPAVIESFRTSQPSGSVSATSPSKFPPPNSPHSSKKSPPSPTVERRQIRRRKKLAPRDSNTLNSPTDPPLASSSSDEPPTALLLPPEIPLPITIQHLYIPDLISFQPPRAQAVQPLKRFLHRRQSDSHVLKTTPLFSYFEGINPGLQAPPNQAQLSALKGKDRAAQDNLKNGLAAWMTPDPLAETIRPEEMVKTYESPVKGELIAWCIEEGQVLRVEDDWRTLPILRIQEPCTHSVQWHGQCAICGSDLTIADYTGISEMSRASIPMSHGLSTLTVSISEARRLESETRERLLHDRKLSLIVDLDQTIVHATVDPTVGEWMAQPKNPNWAALQGVHRFQLQEGPDGGEECYYYLKQRPGLSNFLRNLAVLYEMHVYTMGTRAYANAVCQRIDPNGDIFGNRILSRDESGSMTQKSITRLFPVDTSMVVIIDDRGDVWEFSPNLVSVVPYNFFVGTGDINGAYLPPARQLQAPSGTSDPPPPPPEQDPVLSTSGTDCSHSPIPALDSSISTAIQATATAAISPPSSARLSTAVPSAHPILNSQASEPLPLPPLKSPVGSPADASGSTKSGDESGVADDRRAKHLAEQLLARPLMQKQMELEQSQRSHKAVSVKRTPASSGATVSTGSGESTPSPGQSLEGTSLPTSASTLKASEANTRPASHESSVPSEGSPVTSAQPPSSVSNSLPYSTSLPSLGAHDNPTDSESASEAGRDDSTDLLEKAVLVDRDDELTRLSSILEDIHRAFYSMGELDVRSVIATKKHKVLQGVHLAFSGLWPMDDVSQSQDTWRLAEQFGAICSSKLTHQVTHLVAAKLGTTKTNTALSCPNLAVVKPEWLFDSVSQWRKLPEEPYLWHENSSAVPIIPVIQPSELEEVDDDNDGWGAKMNQFDWQDAEQEIMAALNESSDESGDDNDLEANPPSDSTASVPDDSVLMRKRGRTSARVSPFEGSCPCDLSTLANDSPDHLDQSGSPLSKRQKLARSRSSKLKLTVNTDGGGEADQSDAVENESCSNDQEYDGRRSADSESQGESQSSDQISLTAEEDEFLSALAAEMEGTMNEH